MSFVRFLFVYLADCHYCTTTTTGQSGSQYELKKLIRAAVSLHSTAAEVLQSAEWEVRREYIFQVNIHTQQACTGRHTHTHTHTAPLIINYPMPGSTLLWMLSCVRNQKHRIAISVFASLSLSISHFISLFHLIPFGFFPYLHVSNFSFILCITVELGWLIPLWSMD